MSHRHKQEQEEQIRREAERHRQEEERKRQEKLARRLEQEATNWAKAQLVRAYLVAIEETVVAWHGAIQSGSQAALWLVWAHQHADRLDPLVNG